MIVFISAFFVPPASSQVVVTLNLIIPSDEVSSIFSSLVNTSFVMGVLHDPDEGSMRLGIVLRQYTPKFSVEILPHPWVCLSWRM